MSINSVRIQINCILAMALAKAASGDNDRIMARSPSDECDDEYDALESPSSHNLHDDLSLRLPCAPTVRVVGVERVKALLYTYNMFVIELSLPGHQTWRIRTTTPRLFQLHFFLQKALHFRHVFQFPSSLLAHHTPVEVGQDTVANIETFLTDVFSHKAVWRHPRVLAFVEYSALRFDPLLGDSLVEGWVKMRYVPSRKGTLHGRHSFIGFHFTKDNLLRIAEIAVAVSLCVIIPVGVFNIFVAASSSDTVSELQTGYIVAASILSAIPGLYFVAIMYQYLLRHRRWMVVKPTCIAFFETVRSTAPTHVILFQPHTAISKSTLLKHGLHWMIDGLHVTTPAAIVEIDFKFMGQCQYFHDALKQAMDECMYNSLHKHNSFAPMRPAVGVKVYVLVYREHHMVLPNDSKFAKSSLVGPNIYVLRHPDFVLIPQFWSHHEKIVCIDQTIAFVGGLDIALGRFDSPNHALTDVGATTWTGQDYSNPRLKDFVDVQHVHHELIDRESVPRMPWHDVHCRLEGPIALDIARHFIHRWNFTVQKKYTVIASRTRSCHRRSRIPAIVPYTSQPHVDESPKVGEKVHCQVVRSLCPWSGGVKTEKSIQQAYIDTIGAAKHFIYIENQFFVSGFDQDVAVSNRVVEALYDRIADAHAKRETFRVMFIMPLLPCFEGAVTSADSANLRAVMHWQYTTICRGGHSLLERLAKIMPDPSHYVAFFGLRQHALLNGHVVTEQIYIHSKLLIADDRVAIIGTRPFSYANDMDGSFGIASTAGSANLNDRSLCGDRDSEIAVVLEDSTMEMAHFGRKPTTVGRFGHRLRRRLLEEHLGMDLEDPTSEVGWHTIRSLANNNTDIYERVFQCFPTDKFTSYFHAVPEAHLHEDIRVVYENQRYAWGSGWSADHLIFGERTAWSDAFGMPFDSFTPSASWQVDVSEGCCDSDGWQYAFSFSAFKHDKGDKRSVPLWYRWVRRRKWVLVVHKGKDVGATEVQDESSVDLRKFLRRVSSRMLSSRTVGVDVALHPEWMPPEVEELSHVKGQLVDFPLDFLRDCDLQPLILPKNIFI
ncbi:hypothetical protein DYB32_005171 [Aphanomyces invadans]|uniref:phospholipase D n=1 Tax=Aphanomyces invadans TaxID=157072 RepID=A0A3R7D031_9STRA|nr:hypothetical protein DYB32_005171 [Aphanomyces invadans]